MSRQVTTKRIATGIAGCGALVATMVFASAIPAAAADEPIQLSWDGTEYADTTVESFVGLPVVVPGDHSERTLTVRNDGPSQGLLTVTIDDVVLLDPDQDDSFYDDVTVSWGEGNATLAELDANGETGIVETQLARGETTTVTIGYDFPVDSVSGNFAEVGARSASFDVSLSLGGDAGTVAATEPPSTPDRLAPTGGSPSVWIVVAGAILLPMGLLLRRLRRDRRNDAG